MRRSTITLLGIALLFVGFVFYSLERVEPLQITEDRLVHVGNRVVVQGTVTNTGAQAQEAGIQVRLFDNAGRKVGQQTVSVGKLAPGRSVPFATPPSGIVGAEKFTVEVNHGVNMYGN
jgi:hypothetical protein